MAIKPRILCIEDNPENRLLVQRILMAEGFELPTAESSAARITLADKERPDLNLVDINLPELDGYSVTARLKNIPHLARVGAHRR